MFSPDIVFLGGGVTAAQIFFGLSSHFINFYGLQSEHNGPEAYQDFFR